MRPILLRSALPFRLTALAGDRALRDTVLPLAEPIRGLDGTTVTEIVVPKGTFFFANVRACNTSTALWGGDALEWKPERWMQPLPESATKVRLPGIYSST